MRKLKLRLWMIVIGPIAMLMTGCHSPIDRSSTNMTSNDKGSTSTPGIANNTSGNSSSRSVSTDASPQAIALQLKNLAQSGKVDNSPFVSGDSTISSVEQQWGQPDSQAKAGSGTYASYSQKQAAFGFNQHGVIFDVRSYSTTVQHLTQGDVKSALGTPSNTLQLTNQVNDIYDVNKTYQLEFIVDTNTHKVNHISVFDASAVAASSTSSSTSSDSTQPGTGSTASSSPTPIRGIVEGFYGTPWSIQERISMFNFMKSVKMNTYVYAPKGDKYQRSDWNEPYPTAQLNQMRTLVTAAKSDGVRFVYSISPGIPAPLPGQKLTQKMINQSITYSSSASRQLLEQKMNQLESLGVNTFMLSFDDIETMLKPADKKVYGNQYQKAQMDLANTVYQYERQRDSHFQMWFVPTSYYGLIDGPYWETLRTTLNPNIQVIWTGKWVLNQTITSSQAQTISKLLGRKPILWDNYPVNDYTYDIHQSHQLMMGPLQGRDGTLLNNVSGYLSNPMLQPEASKLALTTIANYLQHPTTYQPLNAWNQAIQTMPGITNPNLFKVFAEYTSASKLNPQGYAPIDEEISEYWNAASTADKSQAQRKLATQFQTLENLTNTLPPTITNQELLTEIRPWITLLSKEGQGGLDALNELNHPNAGNLQKLKQQIQSVTSSSYQAANSIVSFMQKAEQQQ